MIGEARGRVLLRLAREAIAARLGGHDVSIPRDEWLQEPRGVFVTVRNGGRLRGCIGTIEATRALGAAVTRNAALAAFEDPRFADHVDREEFPHVRLEVSVLSTPEPIAFSGEADALAKLRPHLDGVVLRAGRHESMFLPQVWSQLTEPADFLLALEQKAGLSGWRDDIRLDRFTVEKFSEDGYVDAEG